MSIGIAILYFILLMALAGGAKRLNYPLASIGLGLVAFTLVGWVGFRLWVL